MTKSVKIKIPRKIKIGTHSYLIKLNPHLHSDTANYGEINHRSQMIEIWTNAPVSIRNQTLIHEVVHIAQHHYRVEISDADIDRVAQVIADLLFNNLGIEFDWSQIEKKKRNKELEIGKK